MKDKLQKNLTYNLSLLDKSAKTLALSLQKCKKISVKKEYSFEESESFDALSSKFSRTSDIYTQKVLRSVFSLLRERQTTLIDMANRAEKLELITSAKELFTIRDVRNEIAHQYVEEVLFELYVKVLDTTDILFSSIKKTKFYINEKNLINLV